MNPTRRRLEAVWERYPDCGNWCRYNTRFSNGVCDASRGCNTIECGWDGGDCVKLKKYPDCKPTGWWYKQFGNGICNSELNTKECGWDGGDCVELNTKAEHGEQEELTSVLSLVIGTWIFIILIISAFVFYKKRSTGERRGAAAAVGNLPVAASIPVASIPAASSENDPIDRHTLVLTRIIHKKVISLSNKEDGMSTNEEYEATIFLSHEAIVSKRAARIHSLRNGCQQDSKNQDEEAQQINFDTKDDIMVDTLQSIRSSMNSNFNDDKMQDTFNNPRICPICCEEYETGDDIAWSKNEDCCHAYHTYCILPWLMDHSDCPMCRNDYLCLRDVSSC